MSLAYLDASAAMKLIVQEPESEPLLNELETDEQRRLVSSWLLHAELHCAGGRHPEEVETDAVDAVLNAVTLVDTTRGDMLAAGTHIPLRSNDAIHLAVAIRLGADELIAYDRELLAAARSAGIHTLSPGSSAD